MLALSSRRANLRLKANTYSTRYPISLGPPSHRTYIAPVFQRFSEEFLDLALALPSSELIPPYSATIILITVATRLIFTVPFSIWAKRRQWVLEDVVVPKLKEERQGIYQQVLRGMRRDNFRGNEDQAKMELQKRAKPLLDARRKELCSLHRCSPTTTMILPVVSQLPVFVGTTMLLNHMSRAPTVFDSESFLTLTSLAHADPTVTLPIVIGLITFANVESSRWFISAEAAQREDKVKEWVAQKRAKGEVVIQPKEVLHTSLKLLSIGRILLAATFPGSVQLYWATSAAFGLVQSWVMESWDSRRPRPSPSESPSKDGLLGPSSK